MPQLSLFPSRLPVFERADAPAPFTLTQRDMAIVAAVARFRFLSSEQIARLVGGSHQQILRRLRLLFDHGYLDRPEAQKVQLAYVIDSGNRPVVYGLARNGARLLAEVGAPFADRLDWTTKNKRATPLFLAHTLETAEAMIAFELACALQDDARLIDHHALLPLLPEATRGAREPFQCRVSINVPGERSPVTISIVPDRLFSIAFTDATRFNFALELDRGTMDINARRLTGKSSIRRKILGYHRSWLDRRHTEVWGFRSFRVLFITPSDARLNNMLEVQRKVVGSQGSNLFLFSTPQRIAMNGALGAAWVSGKGEVVSLANPEH